MLRFNLRAFVVVSLIFSMLLCMLPMMVPASGDVCQIIDADGVTIIGSYSDFADALAAVNDLQTIKLLEDITYTNSVVITGKSITFDVNGFVLYINVAAVGHGLTVDGGKVLLADSIGGGKFNVTGGTGVSHGVYVINGGEATVTNAHTKANTVSTKDRSVYVSGADSVVTVTGNVYPAFYALEARDGATVTVYGYVSGGGAMIADGLGTTVTVYGSTYGGGTGVFATNDATVYVGGNANGGGSGVYAASGAQVTVNGSITMDNNGAYVTVAGINKAANEHELISSKYGYFEYKNGGTIVWVRMKYTVTFDGNGGEFGSGITTMYVVTPYSTTVGVAKMPGNPTRDGYTFTGWNTEQNGAGIMFTPSTLVTKDITVYAQWTMNGMISEYSVVYCGNGNSDGVVPVDLNNPYLTGDEVTVLGKGSLVRTGYSFLGWATACDIDMADYIEGDTFTINENVVLFAVWGADEYVITYTLDGGVNALGNPSSYSVLDDFPIIIADPTRVGYSFLGWTVKYANGTSLTVPPARPYTIPKDTTGNIQLTALWVVSDVEETIKYTITYHGNGHTSGMIPLDVRSPYVSGSVVIVLDQGNLVKEGYTFLGWTTNPNTNTIITHTPQTTFTILSDTVLYAVWSEGTQQQYTITYQPGTYGTFKEQITSNLNYGDPTPQAPTVTGTVGWKFTGWSPIPTITVEGDAVYVAQWEQEVFTVIFKDWDGTVLKTQEVSYGESASAPANPSRSGYTFTGWDRPFTNIVLDLTVTAQYIPTNGGDSDNSNNIGGGSSSSRPSKPSTTTTPPPVTTIPPNITPPATAPPHTEEEVVAVWALVNLVLSVAGIILVIILTICVLLQRKCEEDEQEQERARSSVTGKSVAGRNETVEARKYRQRRLFWFATVIITSIASIIVFILTEDMNLTMAIVDKWTIVNAALFIVELITIAFVFKHKKDNNNQSLSNPTTTQP